MFQATMCSSSGGQLYEYNIWYNHSVLVAVWYAGRDGTPSCLKHVEDSGKHFIEKIVRQVGYLPEFVLECLQSSFSC